MVDMNFFSVYRKKRAQSKGARIAAILLVVFLLLLNAGVIAGGLMYFDRLEKDNQTKRDWINDPNLAASMAEAEQLAQEVRIVDEYAGLLMTLDGNLQN